jgi:hypothetical protein
VGLDEPLLTGYRGYMDYLRLAELAPKVKIFESTWNISLYNTKMQALMLSLFMY